jgi:hypothetical protein
MGECGRLRPPAANGPSAATIKLRMASHGKTPTVATAAFAFALVYVGFSVLRQLPILLSWPKAAATTGAIVGLLVECAAIAALGFGIFKKRVWAAWPLFVLGAVELMVALVHRDIIDAILPLILGSLALWAGFELRAKRGNNDYAVMEK